MSQLIARHENEHGVFSVRRRTDVWQVTRNQLFCGDFLSRRDAVAAARALAASFEALGGVAEVVVGGQKIPGRARGDQPERLS